MEIVRREVGAAGQDAADVLFRGNHVVVRALPQRAVGSAVNEIAEAAKVRARIDDRRGREFLDGAADLDVECFDRDHEIWNDARLHHDAEGKRIGNFGGEARVAALDRVGLRRGIDGEMAILGRRHAGPCALGLGQAGSRAPAGIRRTAGTYPCRLEELAKVGRAHRAVIAAAEPDIGDRRVFDLELVRIGGAAPTCNWKNDIPCRTTDCMHPAFYRGWARASR